MPTYSFHDRVTNVRWDDFLSIREMEELMDSNTDIEQEFYSMNVISGRDGGIKIDDGFRDLLKTIKKNNRGSNINTR